MSAHRDGQSQALDGQSAEDEGRTRRRGRKQEDCGDGEKEPGWHDQQSGVFHALFPSGVRMYAYPPDSESAPQNDVFLKATGLDAFLKVYRIQLLGPIRMQSAGKLGWNRHASLAQIIKTAAPCARLLPERFCPQQPVLFSMDYEFFSGDIVSNTAD
jgi:hypothetical protein